MVASVPQGGRRRSPSAVPISLAVRSGVCDAQSNRPWQMSHAGPGLVAFVHPTGNANEVNSPFRSS